MNSHIKELIIRETLKDLNSVKIILKRILLNCVDLSREIDMDLFSADIIQFIQDIDCAMEDLEEYGKK